jgi:hypothetical protein
MRLILVILAMLASSLALGQSETFEFKGIALGSDIATIEANPRFSCRNPSSPIADLVCSLRYGENETIAGVPISALLLYYYNGKLQTISISLDSKQFPQVSEALKEKYGEGNVKTDAVQNRMGATFENKILSWRKPGATLEAKRFTSKIDRSSVIYRTDFAIEEFQRRHGSTTKEQAKDL